MDLSQCTNFRLLDSVGESSGKITFLEEQFLSLVTKINLAARCNFDDYLVPNEIYPSRVQECLAMDNPGLIVSAGAERSFFDLALCNRKKCQGLVVVDINPKVKAYVDFNVLLLRIAEDREDYVRLSSSGLSILEELRDKISKTDMSDAMKSYYLEHLEEFAKIYFEVDKKWKEKACFDVRYYEEDLLFRKVQEYAKSGNIIATVGDISQLNFLDGRNIEIVDTSNIRAYVMLDFKTASHPNIVWTGGVDENTSYHVSRFTDLTKKEREEFDRIVEVFLKIDNSRSLLLSTTKPFEAERKTLPMFPSLELLKYLNTQMDRYVVAFLGDRWINFGSFLTHLEYLNDVDTQELRRFNRENRERLAPFIPNIVPFWRELSKETFLTFSEVHGWKKAVKQELREDLEFREKYGSVTL